VVEEASHEGDITSSNLVGCIASPLCAKMVRLATGTTRLPSGVNPNNFFCYLFWAFQRSHVVFNWLSDAVDAIIRTYKWILRCGPFTGSRKHYFLKATTSSASDHSYYKAFALVAPANVENIFAGVWCNNWHHYFDRRCPCAYFDHNLDLNCFKLT
jgi:hypothetical protein